MSRRSAGALLALAVLAVPACSRRSAPSWPASARPSGNGVWFADGFGSEWDETEALERMARGGFSWALIPAARLERRGSRWVVVALAPPARPITSAIVSPVVGGNGDVSATLLGKDARARRALEDALALAVQTVLNERTRFGAVGGVHLDLPLTVETAKPCADVLRRIRSRLPAGLFLSVTLKFTPPVEAREKLKELAGAADGFIAMVFGEGANADPAAADLLGRPWWAGYSPNAEGRWKSSPGEDRGSLPEGFLARLSDDPSLEFRHDMEVEEQVGLGYLFRARRAVTVQGRRFAAGDEVVFQQPFLTDMIRRLGKDLAGRRFARGRVVRFGGRSDTDRIFTLPALSDILMGRSLEPTLRVSIEGSPGALAISAENTTAMPSVLSRVSNWVEVDLARAGIRDVRPGGFDRYEVYAASGHRVSLGRASRVRFYETLIGPYENIAPATVVVRPPVDEACCRFRYHLLSATGPEVTTDWRTALGR